MDEATTDWEMTGEESSEEYLDDSASSEGEERVIMGTEGLDEHTKAMLTHLMAQVFPPLPTVNRDLFDHEYTKQALLEKHGLRMLQSYEARYLYFQYPYIRSEAVFDEPSLQAMQQQIQLQGGSEYCFSYRVEADFIRRVCQSGCFPLGHTISRVEAILVKLHQSRCAILELDRLHVSRHARKKAKNYMITVDGHYDECVRRIHEYHQSSWLYPKLQGVFHQLNQDETSPVRVHSFELWNVSGLATPPTSGEELTRTATLVAGEIGYAVGGNYTSLTGYHCENHAGTVQLVATGKLLQRMGYRVWDFGMTMEYKIKLGAQNVPRQEFLTRYQDAATLSPAPFPSVPVPVRSLLTPS